MLGVTGEVVAADDVGGLAGGTTATPGVSVVSGVESRTLSSRPRPASSRRANATPEATARSAGRMY